MGQSTIFTESHLILNKKYLPYLLIIVLAILLSFIRRCNDQQSVAPATKKTGSKQDPVNRDRGFDRRTHFIEYTAHARCRMQCRKITQAEVEEIMQAGKINYNKSNVKDKPCPTYALEGRTSDDQRVRIVFAQCNETTKCVTVIDLEKDWACDCPGDDNKYKNRN